MRVKFLALLSAALPLVMSIDAHAQSHTAYGSVKLEKLPYSGGVLVARAIRSGAIKLPTSHQVPSNTAGHTPPGALPDVHVSPASQPQDETPIVADPTTGKELLAGANDYNCGSIQGYYFSKNGGKTWAASCGTFASGYSGGQGDPIVAFDTTGVAYRGGIDSGGGGGSAIVVGKTTNDGSTWSTPVVATPNVLGGQADKPWMQIDIGAASPHKNNIYVSSTEFASNNDSQIAVSASSDGGTTWTTVLASTRAVYPVVNQFSDMAIGNDGTIYLTYMRCTANGPASDCGGTKATMYIQKSTDAGATWSTAAKMNTVTLAPDVCGAFYGCLPNTSERVSNIPSIGIDNSAGTYAGKLYVTEYNWTGTKLKVQVISSTNGGTTWSRPKAVSPAQTQDQFFPWLNVSATGTVGVTWLDRRLDSANVNYDAFGTVSTDGGRSYSTNIRLSSASSNPFNDGFGSGFMGDYTGNAWVGTVLHNAWTDTRSSSPKVSQIYTGGLK